LNIAFDRIDMNILYISSKKKWGGVSSWMQQTAFGLEQKGHCIWILAHPNGRFFQTASKDLRVFPKKLGMDYHPMTIFFLIRFIKSHRIHLVVTNIEKEVIAGGVAARFCGIPNIRRVGREDDFNEKFKVKWRHRLLVDQCIVPCDRVRVNAAKRASWLDASRFTTIYNGKNPRRFSSEAIINQRKDWGLSENHMIVGVTSQLAKSKAVDGLIRVFAKISDKFPQCRLVITGEGSEKENLQTLARELGLSRTVVFAGFSDHPMQSSAGYDIAVSNSRFEGFPNNVVEYFAVGKAVVTTDAGGVTEMAKHQKNALVIPCDNDDRLYQSITALIEDAPLRHRLGKHARRTIEQGFSEGIMIDRLEHFFLKNIHGI
jgi:glycosyltransferase involved in cell wall biosynthesis